jgi:two-component system NtrC family response regulator
MANILIVDDDEMMTDVLTRKIGRAGHYVRYVLTLGDALRVAREEQWDLVLLGARLPDGDGLEALPAIHGAPSAPQVIVFTGAGDLEGAKDAIKSGAWDYLEKGVSTDQILLSLGAALEYREEKRARKPPSELKREKIVGGSRPLLTCLDQIAEAASTDANVLITGETGTGKELIAEAVHANSARAKGAFVVVDCTSLPETLIESMLFGYERGAFTGAFQQQEGLFKQADGGTLFLDEVGELPPSRQKAFLRILQEHRFRPIGSRKEVASDFRVVAASNRNLDLLAQAGEFRKDLLFRLRSLVIVVPPLRERREDIAAIVEYHVNRLCKQYGVAPKRFSPDFLGALICHDWPGNIRELINALEKAMSGARHEPCLYPRHLPTEIRVRMVESQMAGEFASGESPESPGLPESPELPGLPESPGVAAPDSKIGFSSPSGLPPEAAPVRPGSPEPQSIGDAPGAKGFPRLKDWLDAGEKQYLQKLLSRTQGNVMQAARISGLSRARLYVRLKKHGLSAITASYRAGGSGLEGGGA